MTVDQEVARPLLTPVEIEHLESFSLRVPVNSVDKDAYRVVLLHYAGKIMFSPWIDGRRDPSNTLDLSLADRAVTELSNIRQEIERLDRKDEASTPSAASQKHWAGL